MSMVTVIFSTVFYFNHQVFMIALNDFFLPLPRTCVLILARREGKKTERQRNINVREKHWSIAHVHAVTADWNNNLGMCLTTNQTHDLLVHGAMLQLTEPHQQGLIDFWGLVWETTLFPKSYCYKNVNPSPTCPTEHIPALTALFHSEQFPDHSWNHTTSSPVTPLATLASPTWMHTDCLY